MPIDYRDAAYKCYIRMCVRGNSSDPLFRRAVRGFDEIITISHTMIGFLNRVSGRHAITIYYYKRTYILLLLYYYFGTRLDTIE